MILTKPFPFQAEDARRIKAFGGRALLAAEMGLGKSLIALLFAELIKLRPIIVVCPASVKWVWDSEARKHVGLRSEILSGMSPERNGLTGHAPIVIINYDILGPWLPYLKSIKPALVILDECHALMSRQSQRSKNCKKLCSGIPHVLALSGTPLVNRPADLWQTLNILWPKSFPNFWSYGHRFCGPKRTFWGWDFRGASNLKELHSTLKSLGMIRRRKVDVLQDLPPKQRTIVPFDISAKDRKEYDQAESDFLGWLGQRKPSGLKRAARAQGLVQLGHLKRLAGEFKIGSVIEWVDDFLANSEEKLILYAVHRKVIKRLRKRWGPACVVVDGSTPAKDRQLAVRKFLSHKSVRVFIGNIRAAGTGWSAKGVSDVAFAELDWTPGLHSQAEDRCCGLERGKQGVASNAWYFVAKDTIEEKLAKILQAKQRTISKTLDGKRGVGDLDLFDKLCEELRKERQ